MAIANDPVRITDLHNHLVPGVDDGAATMEESLAALCALYEEGVRTLICTPHVLLPHLDGDDALGRELDRQRRAFDRLVTAAHRRTDMPELGLGQEVWAPDVLQARRVATSSALSLGAGDYVLVEFGFERLGNVNEVVRTILDAGRRMIIAHPERYRFPAEIDPVDVIAGWRELGALLQMNVGSPTGYYPGVEPLAWRLLDAGLVDFFATDHHGPRREGVWPKEAYDALASRGREAEARRLFSEAPAAVVRNEVLVRA